MKFDWERAGDNMWKRVPGLTQKHNSDMSFEDWNGKVMIEFGSTHGRTDEANGLALATYLKALGVKHDADGRRVIMALRPFKRIFG
jgi:hypothetical protein